MNENANYISEEELEQLILQVEQKELVSAPPDLMENILVAAGLAPEVIEVNPKMAKKKEFYAYCFRVITSVAAAVALVFLLPEMTEWMGQKNSALQGDYEKYAVVEMIPDSVHVLSKVPDREMVTEANRTPSKEEVLTDIGVVERIIRNTKWFNPNNNNK